MGGGEDKADTPTAVEKGFASLLDLRYVVYSHDSTICLTTVADSYVESA
jgi:hypothetical protein